MADQEVNEEFIAITNTIRSEDVETLADILASGVNPNIADQHGHTALMEAAVKDSQGCLLSLLQNGADPNSLDNKDNTALMKAARAGNDNCVRALIDNGANVRLVNKSSDTALNLACLYGHLNTAMLLVEAGANLHQETRYDSVPLPADAGLTRLAIVKDAVDSGAYLSAEGHFLDRVPKLSAGLNCFLKNRNKPVRSFDGSPTMCSPYLDPDDVVKYAVGVVANPDLRKGLLKDSAIICACRDGHFDLCQYLVSVGAVPDFENSYGMSALMIAAAGHDTQTLSFLLHNGADVNHTNVYGRNALHVAALNGALEAVDLLLEAGSNLESVTCQLDTPLLLAIKHLQVATMEFLIGRGANVSHTDQDGNTPLILAAACDETGNMLQRLLFYDYDINWRNQHGVTALLAAANEGYPQCVHLLLYVEGVDIHAQTNRGMTALELAVVKKSKTTDVVKLLLEFGAKPANALYFAVSRKKHDVIQTLVKCGALPELFTPLSKTVKNLKPPETNRQLTPLTLALCVGDVKAAKYFVSNYFLHESDYTTASYDVEFRDYLTRTGKITSLDFLDDMISQPWTLVSQSLLTVSHLIGYGPTRVDTISSLCLPLTLKDKLLYKDASVDVKTSLWNTISFEHIHGNLRDLKTNEGLPSQSEA